MLSLPLVCIPALYPKRHRNEIMEIRQPAVLSGSFLANCADASSYKLLSSPSLVQRERCSAGCTLYAGVASEHQYFPGKYSFLTGRPPAPFDRRRRETCWRCPGLTTFPLSRRDEGRFEAYPRPEIARICAQTPAQSWIHYPPEFHSR